MTTNERQAIRILIVEDNPERVEFFRLWFQHPRVRILHVRHGDTALQCVRSDRFDLILLDHDLVDEHPMGIAGKIDGRGVAREIAIASQHRRTPVIIHSMNPGGRNQMYRILRANGMDAIIKPFSDWTSRYADDWLQDLLVADGAS